MGESAPDDEAPGSEGTVNDAVVQGKYTFLSGEICPWCVEWSTGDGLRTFSKGKGSPPVPTVHLEALRSVTTGVKRQKSAEAIVAVHRTERWPAKGRTLRNKEES